MKYKTIATVALAVFLLAGIGNAYAENSAPNTVNKGVIAKTKPARSSDEEAQKAKGLKEIEKRIASLNTLNTRIQAMTHVGADVKASIGTTIQKEIASLTALKSKIEADTDAAALKADLKSITADYRIYMLVIPQGRIMAEADRAGEVADTLTTLATKLDVRLTAAKTAGKDVTSLTTALVDMKAKIADAKTKAAAASSSVAGLTPDGGDKTKALANTAVLKTAKQTLQTANADLKAARKDADVITKGFKKLGEVKTASTTENTKLGQ